MLTSVCCNTGAVPEVFDDIILEILERTLLREAAALSAECASAEQAMNHMAV